MNVGSLFSGISGIEVGLHAAGFQPAWFCERDAYCRRVLAVRWPGVPIHQDARTVGPELAPVDVLTAGFPCPDFSVAGQRAGLDGTSGRLWFEVARVVRLLRPRFVLVENVPSLLVRGMDVILGDLAASGYDAEWDCVPAAAIGSPHLRARVWLLAYPAGFGDRLPEGRVYAGWQGALHDSRWDTEPVVGRVADGVPFGVDRRRVLGNSVVPAIAEWIGRRIVEVCGVTAAAAPRGQE